MGETEYLQLIRDLLQGTPNYIRQRQIWQTTGSQQAVVAFLVRQLKQELGSLLLSGQDLQEKDFFQGDNFLCYVQ